MLRLLTDEHISPAVAEQSPRQCKGIHVLSIQNWNGGQFLGASDELVLREAHKHRLTLVTYDLRTVPSLLRAWAIEGNDHSGIILVGHRTVAQDDLGGLIAGLCVIWKTDRHLDWTNRVVYLRAS